MQGVEVQLKAGRGTYGLLYCSILLCTELTALPAKRLVAGKAALQSVSCTVDNCAKHALSIFASDRSA